MVVLSVTELFAQAPQKVPGGGGGSGPWPCPVGCGTTVTYVVTTINFHKPRTDCQHGFGFCIKGYWEQGCNCGFFKATTSIEGNEVKAVAKFEGSKMYLYIPYALKDIDEYKNEDTDTFTVGEENSSLVNSKGDLIATLIPGDYPTKVEAGNFVVIIDVK